VQSCKILHPCTPSSRMMRDPATCAQARCAAQRLFYGPALYPQLQPRYLQCLSSLITCPARGLPSASSTQLPLQLPPSSLSFPSPCPTPPPQHSRPIRYLWRPRLPSIHASSKTHLHRLGSLSSKRPPRPFVASPTPSPPLPKLPSSFAPFPQYLRRRKHMSTWPTRTSFSFLHLLGHHLPLNPVCCCAHSVTTACRLHPLSTGSKLPRHATTARRGEHCTLTCTGTVRFLL
jgi:hypothetical protein